MLAFSLGIRQVGQEITMSIFSTPETQPLTADLQSLYDSTVN